MTESIISVYKTFVSNYLARKKQGKQINFMVSKFALIITFLLVLAGCATPTIDVSESIYRPDTKIDKSANHPISALNIVNNAPEEKTKIRMFRNQHVFIKREPDPRVTVEEDVNRYFEERLLIDQEAIRNLRVQIDKVRIYRIETVAQLYGGLLALLTTSYEYVMQIKLSIDVKEADQIVSTYYFDDSISMRARVSRKAEDLIYKKLFAQYRKNLFNELDKKIISKYFAKT